MFLMSSGFDLLLLTAAFGFAAAVLVILIPLIFAPKKPSSVKHTVFECGQVPIGEGKRHFMMQYYAYLLMFVVFDVVSMFLFAWGVSYIDLGFQSAVVITAFLAVILVPIGYALTLAGRRELW